MICKTITSILFIFAISTFIYSQTPDEVPKEPLTAKESLEFIAADLQEIARGLRQLNTDISKAYSRIADNMGLSLTEDQRKLIVSFEILNRAELRMSNLQKSKIELLEKKIDIESQIGILRESATDESIARSISTIGTTDAKALRERRYRVVNAKINRLNNVLSDIENSLLQTNSELMQTMRLVGMIRSRLFPAIYRELPKLEYQN